MKIQILIFVLIFGLGRIWLFGQAIPDVNSDPAWVLVPAMSDEFNTGTTFDNSKWTWTPGYTVAYPNNEYGTYSGSACYDNSSNVISIQSESGTSFMRLSAKKISSSCEDGAGNTYVSQYMLGNLIGLTEQQYGYFEIKVRISNILPAPLTYSGISANAWLWRSWVPANGVWSEIDLAEIFPYPSNMHTCNVIYDPNEWDQVWVGPPLNQYIPIPSQNNMRCPVGSTICNSGTAPTDFALSNGWHTYQAVWYPTGIAIYCDGRYINSTVLGCPGMEPLNWIFGLGTTEHQQNISISSNTFLPFNMDIDYVRTYKLNSNCDNQVINSVGYNVNTYDGNHKKSINFGGIGGSTSVTSGASIYMKATDYIQINGEFVVPVGATFVADVLPCF